MQLELQNVFYNAKQYSSALTTTKQKQKYQKYVYNIIHKWLFICLFGF